MANHSDRHAVAILKSTDIQRTEQWYVKVGFSVRGRHPDLEPTWCELERNGTVLQFLAGDTPWPGRPALTGCVYVYCDDVEAVYAELRDQVHIEWGIEDRDWGVRELVLCDPDGYFITFAQQGQAVIECPASHGRPGKRPGAPC
jgi:catechol 2,3-dioxygenase-like lactoylglutathione lyase family enzyme